MWLCGGGGGGGGGGVVRVSSVRLAVDGGWCFAPKLMARQDT